MQADVHVVQSVHTNVNSFLVLTALRAFLVLYTVSYVLMYYTSSVRNKVAKVVGQMSEHFEFGLDMFISGSDIICMDLHVT